MSELLRTAFKLYERGAQQFGGSRLEPQAGAKTCVTAVRGSRRCGAQNWAISVLRRTSNFHSDSKTLEFQSTPYELKLCLWLVLVEARELLWNQEFRDSKYTFDTLSQLSPEKVPVRQPWNYRPTSGLRCRVEITKADITLAEPKMTASLALLEPSSLENVPEEFDGVLDCTSLAICCSFNRRGSLLAVGCNDGRIAIWDFLTRGIAKTIPAHANHPVCSISWSRNGQKLVSASLDNTIAIWKVLDTDCLMRWRFPSPILKAQFNPRNDRLVLVCPIKHAPILIEIDYEQNSINYKVLPVDKEDADPNIIASFDKRGQYIYTGNAKGKLAIISCPKSLDAGVEPEIVSSFRIQTTGSTLAAIREIEFGARNKTHFLVNSSDRTIRLFECNNALKAGVNGVCEEIRKFQDLVNKTMWRRCCFSGDARASHVCGGSARQHALYIWETENGTIKKMLQGTKGELLLDVQWHPLRPIVTSISSGLISIWARPQIENWSAFAPDFKELEENMEYEERESEFDLEDEDNHPDTKRETAVEESETVNVTEVRPEVDLLSSDEEEEDPDFLEFIPISFEEYEIIDQQLQQDSKVFCQPKMIDITLENPPTNEQHPLSQGSSKRIRVNDKINRKIPRNA